MPWRRAPAWPVTPPPVTVAIDVHLAGGAGGFQGLADDHLQGLQAEIIVNIAAVDGDGTGAALRTGGRGQQRTFFCRCRT